MSESSAPKPTCGWCGEPAVTDVITVPGRAKRKTAPVCETHAKDFERRGVKTVRVEADEQAERLRKKATWLKQNNPRRS